MEQFNDEIISEDIQKCSKCNKYLPLTREYYFRENKSKRGYRRSCKICDGDAKEYGIKPKLWSESEVELLKEIYCDLPTSEIIDRGFFKGKTMNQINSKAGDIGLKKSEKAKAKRWAAHSEYMKKNCAWIGKKLTEEEKLKLSEKMKQRWIDKPDEMLEYARYERTEWHKQRISEANKAHGYWKGDNNPRHKNPLHGSKNGNWKGGITDVYFWLRNQIDQWKEDSMIAANYQCDITGRNFDEIHHLQSFKDIYEETVETTGYKGKDISKFNDEELEQFRKDFMEVHNKYGLGICLLEGVHKLFHDTYGYKSSKPEHYYEFKERIKNGEFQEELEVILKNTNKK